MKVVVFGASGTIGRPLLDELARTHEVVAVSRHEQGVTEGVVWKTADATERDAVARVLEGCDVAYYLVHSLGSADFEEVDLRAAETTALAAESAGVKTADLPRWARRRFPRSLTSSSQPSRDGCSSGLHIRSGDDSARRDGRRPRERCVRDDRRFRSTACPP